MKTAEEFYNEIEGNHTIIELMEMYALEVAKETQRRCAENAKMGGSLIRDENNRIIGVTNPIIDKSSILDPKNLAI